jgi:FtsH-binding integral membrane protein
MYPNPYDYQQPNQYGYGGAEAAVPANLMTRVYQWMALGLGVTGATALIAQSVPSLMQLIWGTPLRFVLLLALIGMAVGLGGFVMRMSAPVAFAVFFAFAAVNGLALAPIFYVFEAGSIANTFFVTAGMFGAVTLWGYVTKRDLSGWGTFLMMGLVGLIIASIVNMIAFGFGSPLLYWLTTYMGVIVFTGLTAYDTQRIKRAALASGNAASPQLAIQGATLLYLDFINLFMYLLRLFGRARRD